MLKTAIWGATGHIGRALYEEFTANGLDVTAYVRDTEKAKRLGIDNPYPLDSFNNRYDILINALAADDNAGTLLFETLELNDWRMIRYAQANPGCLCVNFSSGTVYGDFTNAATKTTSTQITPNDISTGGRYALVKLLCEQRHKAYALKIVDIRIFAFYSKFMDITKPFFMADLLRGVLTDTEIQISPGNFYRDFIAPSDLYDLIILCRSQGFTGALDAYSLKPVSKYEILELFKSKYGLKYSTGESWSSATGDKHRYYSNYKAAEFLGFQPKFTALSVIETQTDALRQV